MTLKCPHRIPDLFMKSVFLDYATLGTGDLDLSSLNALLPDLQVFENTAPAERIERVRDAEVVFCNKTRLDAETLKCATSLKFIALTATGTDNVDLEYARNHQIAVCNLLSYCTQSVVEHVFATMLNLTHSIHSFNKLVRSGEWEKADNFCKLDFPVRQLSAMTLGIVGYGELGKGIEKMALQTGMQVMIARRRSAVGENDGRHDFKEVLRKAAERLLEKEVISGDELKAIVSPPSEGHNTNGTGEVSVY